MIKQLPLGNSQYENSLFSGVLGLTANESSDVKSVVEHLKETKQIDSMIVAYALNEFEKDRFYGSVSIGAWEKKYLTNLNQKEPLWTPMSLILSSSTTRGGWVFGATTFMIGDNDPIFFYSNSSVVKVMLMNEKDIGYNFITNKLDVGINFINILKKEFAKLEPECQTFNKSGAEIFDCQFRNQQCPVVEKALGMIQIRLPEKKARIDLNISDVLFQDDIGCKLNIHVHVDPTLKDVDRRLEIGLATFVRSQYVVFDYDK